MEVLNTQVHVLQSNLKRYKTFQKKSIKAQEIQRISFISLNLGKENRM